MRITDLLDVKSIKLGASASSKSDALDKVIDLMVASGKIDDAKAYREGVYAREDESTTGIGEGIAIPHCKSNAVNAPGLAAMTVPDGVDFDSLDGQPANLFFLIAAPNTEDNVHLDVLSKLSMLLMDEDFTNGLRAATSVEEFLAVIDAAEAGDAEEAEGNGASEPDAALANAPLILAVTGCPTGIAHTYMAAEAIEKKAAEMGVRVKVETRGSGGAKNVLTADEIAQATGIIVAADTKVPMDRFAGKPLVNVHVAEGISNPGELISAIIDGKADAFVAAGSDSEKEEAAAGGIGHQIYTHLMSGVSHMLPFVIGGGILIALAFLVDTICGYGASGGGDFGSMTPLSAFLKYVGGLSMGLMVPVFAGYIAYSIADRPGLAVGFTGGLLASNGNAIIDNFVFNGTSMGGFSTFISNFAFASSTGGSTVSGFLGGIIAGFLAGYVVLGLKKLCSNMPDSLDGIKPMLIYPLVGILIVGILMCMIFNPLIGLINTGLSVMLNNLSAAGLLIPLGCILGGMMAIDMGGPINKAAYVFGSGIMLGQANDMLSAGTSVSDPRIQACYIAMACVMVGGMVPPLGIAIACKVFKNKFTKQEQSTWITNIVMACSFITEGAIPFAAADPGRVIPCTFVGAAVAGGLSAAFGCTLMAPHGGIFVFATVGNPLFYVLAWLIGSIVTAVMLGFIKKNADQL